MYNMATGNPDLARIEHHRQDFQFGHGQDVNPYPGRMGQDWYLLQDFFPSVAKITVSGYNVYVDRDSIKNPNRLPKTKVKTPCTSADSSGDLHFKSLM